MKCTSLGLSLSTQSSAGAEAGEERVCGGWRLLPQKLKQLIETVFFNTPPKGRGRQWFWFFADLSGRVWFAVIIFFSAIACSAACGFLFLNANVGACFFKKKKENLSEF